MFVIGSHFLAAAADYPTKPIRIVCPYAAGGSLDVVSRAFAAAAEKYLGQVLVVVNKPGALGMIGELEGTRAKPDGYTMTTRATSSVSTMEWEKIGSVILEGGAIRFEGLPARFVREMNDFGVVGLGKDGQLFPKDGARFLRALYLETNRTTLFSATTG